MGSLQGLTAGERGRVSVTPMIFLKIAAILVVVIFVFALVVYMAIAIIAAKLIEGDHYPWE